MSAPDKLGPPKRPISPRFATVMSRRQPGTKYHANAGHALNAVLYKIYYSGAAADDMALYKIDESGDFVKIGEWKYGDQVDKNALRDLLLTR